VLGCTSTLALRVVQGDEKGTRCLGVYNWVTLSLGDMNTGTWSSRLGIGRKADGPCSVKISYCCEIQKSENRMQSGRTFCGSKKSVFPMMMMMMMMMMLIMNIQQSTRKITVGARLCSVL
jgi:hypothetical protein